MNPEWCDPCDMTKAFCIHGNPATEAGLLERSGPTIEAQFSSTDCAGCGDRIQAGSTITMTPDGWAHTREVEQPEQVAPPINHVVFED